MPSSRQKRPALLEMKKGGENCRVNNIEASLTGVCSLCHKRPLSTNRGAVVERAKLAMIAVLGDLRIRIMQDG